MAAKKSAPPPIDRPLSKAYLRKFTGWSNDYPPGQSDPTSLRVMDNVWVNRNGALAVRPGLRHLNWTHSPGMDPGDNRAPGRWDNLPVVSGLEPFYLGDGSPAMLYAVKLSDGRVGFMALKMMDALRTVHTLNECGFDYDESLHAFSAKTSHVFFVQIDNMIIALSDAGEPARHFAAGPEKHVSIPGEITVPAWLVDHKPGIVHPDADWIVSKVVALRTNLLNDPALKIGAPYWTPDAGTQATPVASGIELRSLPARTNLVNSPLVSGASTTGWFAGGNSSLDDSGPGLRLVSLAAGRTSARSSRITGIEETERYILAFDIDFDATLPGSGVQVRFYSCAGSAVGYPVDLDMMTNTQRFTSTPFRVPEGAVSMDIEGFGEATATGQWFAFSKVVMCKEGEPTTAFDGSSGTDYYWTGTPGQSASVHHPPAPVGISSTRVRAKARYPYTFGAVVSASALTSVKVELETLKSDSTRFDLETATAAADPTDAYVTITRPDAGTENAGKWARGRVSAAAVPRGVAVRIRGGNMERATTSQNYFDGNTASSDPTVINSWFGAPHYSQSRSAKYDAARPNLTPETPTADTLVSSDAAENIYKFAVFYTFENEVGETPPSQIAEIRMQRPWSNWLWKSPDANGKPADATTDPEQCADQLVVTIPADVYETAVQQGARRWVLYGMSWSDQDPVPVTAEKLATLEIYPDPLSPTAPALSYIYGGWLAITPQRTIGTEFLPLPTGEEPNLSRPLRHKFGTAIGDRLIMVGDPTDPATISWSSNQPGRHTVFSPSSGGGQKTLSSGNLHLPHGVVLWQNPQSQDTITLLCTSNSERSVSYYMSPASIQMQGGSAETVFGFEETTNTPGSKSPYAAEVLNNALYRSTDTALIKSTASNYNISHKIMTETISEMWSRLVDKQLMSAEQLDSRLYFLVHNTSGELLKSGNTGNEIWVLDTAAEQGHWSRFTVQGSTLKVVIVGSSAHVVVAGRDGIKFFDTGWDRDHAPWVDDTRVFENPIQWKVETNLQGANRAHDAWAHLQQVQVTLGSFQGSLTWGIRGYSMHGKVVDLERTARFEPPDFVPSETLLEWGVEDSLLVRRDLREWTFHASSVPGMWSSGTIELVQYRYTPTTVNIGYESGSVETFEYGRHLPDTHRDGIPREWADGGRSWTPGAGTWGGPGQTGARV